MSRTLYELRMADSAIRPSPFCWIVRFSLMHKGLDFDTVPLRFAEKENYPDPEYGKVPVLRDGGKQITDSCAICDYLDETYPDQPLFASSGERAMHELFLSIMYSQLFKAIAPLMFLRVFQKADPLDHPYFRETRESFLGRSLEDAAMTPGQDKKVEAAFKTLVTPLQTTSYLGGDQPNLTDYTFAGVMMWQKMVTSEELYEAPALMTTWFERMLDLFDGYGREALPAATSNNA